MSVPIPAQTAGFVTSSPTIARRSSFAGDVVRLAAGTLSSQLIGVLAAPFIARMFSPVAFGELAAFAAISGIISVVSCLRYEIVINLPKEEEEAANVAVLSLSLATVTSFATALLILVFGKALGRLEHAPELTRYLWLLPLNVFLTSVWTILNCWNQRKRAFGRLTIMQIVMRVALVSSQLTVGCSGFVSGRVLILTTIFGALVASSVLGWQTLREDGTLFARAVSWKEIMRVRRRYEKFPRLGLAAILLNSVSFLLPIPLLASFFNMAVVGSYSFGLRILRVPGDLIGNNINRAFFPRAAEAKHQGTLGRSVEQALRYLVILSFFPCFLLTLTGGSLFTLVFGSNWHEAGVYAQILSVWLFFWFVSSPLNTVFAVLEEQGLELRFQMANIVTRLVALVTGGLFGSARVAIALFAICGVGVYGSYCVAVIRKSGASGSLVARVMLSRLLQFAPAAALIGILRAAAAPPVAILVATTLILLVYYWNWVRTDSAARQVISQFMRRPSLATE